MAKLAHLISKAKLHRQRLATAAGVVLALVAVAAFSVAPAHRVPVHQSLVTSQLPVEVSTTKPIVFATVSARSERLLRGDSLASLLARAGVKDPSLMSYLKKDGVVVQGLQKSKPGQTFQLEILNDGRLSKLTAIMDAGKIVRSGQKLAPVPADEIQLPSLHAYRFSIEREIDIAQGFISRKEPVTLVRSVEIKQATVDSSLFGATDSAGIPELVVNQLAEIFESDVDFDQDIKRGDTIRVVYETLSVLDSIDVPLPGRVLAAEFQNNNRQLQAIWFERDAGKGEYFTAAGNALKKSFLRSPLEFTRVSSGFTGERKHPVFRDWRAHRGVDYAAPQGTKVRSIGDGEISFLGRQGDYGNMLVVKHSDKHSTAYAHLQEFAKGLALGKKVLQGDIIGSVGQTGWATGPHLHFEFRIYDEPADPLNMELPSARPMSIAETARFGKAVAALKAQLALSAQWRSARFE